MLQTIKKICAFLKDIVSEVDGSGSASRVVGLIITLTTMSVLIAVSIWKHELPSGDQLSGLAKIVACGTAAYAANQASKALVVPPSTEPDDPLAHAIGFTQDGPDEDIHDS